MNAFYIISLIFHFYILFSMYFVFHFGASISIDSLISTKGIFTAFFILFLTILNSEILIRVDFSTFRFVKRYSELQYMMRRLLRDFLIAGAFSVILFGFTHSKIGLLGIVLYYLVVTPLPYKFNQYTRKLR